MTLSDRYQFLLFDKTDTTFEGEIVNIIEASESETFQGAHTLNLTLPMTDSFGLPEVTFRTEAASPFPLLDFIEKKYIRKVDLIAGTTTRFLVQRVETARDGGDLQLQLTLEPRRFLAIEQIVNLFGTYAGLTASRFLDLIVAGTADFSAGTVDIAATEFRTLKLAYPTVMEAVDILLNEWSDDTTTYYFNITETGVINIRSAANTGTTHVEPIEYFKNLITLDRTADARSMANRIYGTGNDEVLTLASANSTRYLDDTIGTSITTVATSATETLTSTEAVVVNSIIFIEVEFQSIVTAATNIDFNYTLQFLNAADTVRVTRTLTRRHAHTGSGTFTLKDRTATLIDSSVTDIRKVKLTIDTVDDSATQLTSFYGRLFKRGYNLSSTSNLAYVEDTASQATYGIREGSVKIDRPFIYNEHGDAKDVPAAAFLGLDALMSGTYTAGVHAGWAASGGATLSENTTGTFIRNGTKSQKVVTTAAAQGAVVPVTSFVPGAPLFAFGEAYSSEIWIYIESGSVEIKMEEEQSGAVVFTGILRGVGWNSIRAENWRLDNTVSSVPIGAAAWESCGLQIKSLDDAGGTFYIDSVCHHRGNAFLGFVDGASADELHAAALKALSRRKNPTLTYTTEVVDLQHLPGVDGAVAAATPYNVGDTVGLVDEEIGINETTTLPRITRVERDLTQPDVLTLTLDDTEAKFVRAIRDIVRSSGLSRGAA